ncbi:MAG TPA: sigma-54 dependent transcriptional regulator [Steroidobacter sp.]|uniref:sigma-54 interaction domain-containing protein n=1 Tax=Steroidobacter sp. TaxID=1978227 RepID=UPI002EDA6B4D
MNPLDSNRRLQYEPAHDGLGLGKSSVAELETEQDQSEKQGGDTQVGGLGSLVGVCPPMRELFQRIRRVAPTAVSILLTGESGTGKELVAETIHSLSAGRDEPFVAVNCGAIPATLVEAELFGYERGSFTGAIRAQAGYFERAGRGTLFLDEAGEMPLEMQVKLLRALESRRFTRVGGERELPLQARVIAATNRPLSEALSDNKLRADLMYRLAVFHLHIPPLRQRGEDIYLLARSFLQRLNEAEGREKALSADSLRYLRQHHWPGNVRELYNTVQRAFILADQQLDLRSAADCGPDLAMPGADGDAAVTFRDGMSLAEVEQVVIIETLRRCDDNKTKTAAVLGISLKTLYNRLNQYRALA